MTIPFDLGAVVRILVPALLCTLAAVLAYVATSVPEIPPTGGVEDRWKLPTRPERAGAEQVAAAAARRSLWEGATAATAMAAGGAGKPLTPPDWRVIATAVSGAGGVVLIRVGNETPYELRVGDELPGGAIIRAIEADRLLIELKGTRRYLSIPPR